MSKNISVSRKLFQMFLKAVIIICLLFYFAVCADIIDPKIFKNLLSLFWNLDFFTALSQTTREELSKPVLYCNIYTGTIVFSFVIYYLRDILSSISEATNIRRVETGSKLTSFLHGLFVISSLWLLYWLVTDKIFHYHYFIFYDSIYEFLLFFRRDFQNLCGIVPEILAWLFDDQWFVKASSYITAAFIGAWAIAYGLYLNLKKGFSIWNYDIAFIGTFFILFSMNDHRLLDFNCTALAYFYCLVGLRLMLASRFVIFDWDVDEKIKEYRMEIGCILTTTACFLAYLPYYIDKFGPSIVNVFFANIINIVQIITVNSNSYELCQNANPSSWILFIRGYCHIALPIIFAYMAFGFILQGFNDITWKMKRIGNKDIYLFSEINKLSISMARSMLNNKNSLVVMFYDNKVPEKYRNSDILFLARHKFTDLIPIKVTNFISDKDMYEGSLRSKLHYYCISENAEKNISDCLRLMKVYGYHDYSDNLTMDVFCEHKKIAEDLCFAKKEIIKKELNDLEKTNNQPINTDFVDKININFHTRYHIAWEKLLKDEQFKIKLNKIETSKKCNCVLIGFDKVGDEIIDELINNLLLTNTKFTVNIIVEDRKRFTNILKMRHKNLFDKVEHKPKTLPVNDNLKIQPIDLADNGESELQPKDFLHIFDTDLKGYSLIEILRNIQGNMYYNDEDLIDFIIVCRGDDEKNLETAYYLDEHRSDYCQQNQDPPYIALYLQSESLTEVVQEIDAKNIDNKIGYHLFSSFHDVECSENGAKEK